MNIKSAIKRLEKQKILLGVRRDALRELASELEDLKETCETAYDDLDRVIDKLSELV
jgi:uncharacterized protein YukE